MDGLMAVIHNLILKFTARGAGITQVVRGVTVILF